MTRISSSVGQEIEAELELLSVSVYNLMSLNESLRVKMGHLVQNHHQVQNCFRASLTRAHSDHS